MVDTPGTSAGLPQWPQGDSWGDPWTSHWLLSGLLCDRASLRTDVVILIRSCLMPRVGTDDGSSTFEATCPWAANFSVPLSTSLKWDEDSN